ncbi:MAG: hypothetical protein IT318_08425 [Anaerolineales bacterium]|nr:hypothetical protein [Anaerolineales bacterium]
MSTPKLVAVVPSEDFLQSLSMPDRRISIHRVFYDLFAPTYPAQARRIPVTMIFCGGAGKYQGRLQLVDPAGDTVAEARFSFQASTMFVQHAVVGGELRFPGEYRLDTWLEDRLAMSVPLTVVSTAPDEGVAAGAVPQEAAPDKV